MADQIDPLPIPNDPTSKQSFREAVYGSIDSSSSAHDSAIEVSPTEVPQRAFPRPHQYRIIPPRVNGHGHLIVVHREVPYFVGISFVFGAFAWAVWCAIYAYPLLGGHSNDWKSGHGGA
ncbi:hypothetical protein EJ02DRAFT_365332 [Clathrospora elynae]|uniref:Uncharacterized protein n=1 Tax=Clathrospora elynae TaxID=706981 RepID=A0A6A5T4V7_9PLEO|nr:hypothetical protein EJ02DRAFT_365332 [Clathrospora elynae]